MTEPRDETFPPRPEPPDTPTTSEPAQAYRGAVAEIIDARRPDRPYPPGAPHLTITRHHRPRSEADLAPAELAQLRAVLAEEGGLAEVLADEENDVEAAAVVDQTGAVRYRLYGMNFGAGYLFPAEGLEIVAFGAQHDLEHWSLSQRDIFAAMDRALRAGGHGFTQPLHFCWADESCWDEIADAEPHSRQSEPYLRQLLARAAG